MCDQSVNDPGVADALASITLEYMLMSVKPGMVLSSLTRMRISVVTKFIFDLLGQFGWHTKGRTIRRRHISQASLAERMGASLSTVRRMERTFTDIALPAS